MQKQFLLCNFYKNLIVAGSESCNSYCYSSKVIGQQTNHLERYILIRSTWIVDARFVKTAKNYLWSMIVESWKALLRISLKICDGHLHELSLDKVAYKPVFVWTFLVIIHFLLLDDSGHPDISTKRVQ
jgi:hypothetical protein